MLFTKNLSVQLGIRCGYSEWKTKDETDWLETDEAQ